jgi:hypothetical protein
MGAIIFALPFAVTEKISPAEFVFEFKRIAHLMPLIG